MVVTHNSYAHVDRSIHIQSLYIVYFTSLPYDEQCECSQHRFYKPFSGGMKSLLTYMFKYLGVLSRSLCIPHGDLSVTRKTHHQHLNDEKRRNIA